MLLSLIILYILTLTYLSIVERFRNYASVITVQGWILLGIALLRLHSLDWIELGFIITETLIFKAIIVPAILHRVINKTKINRVRTSGTSQFNSLMLSIAALIIIMRVSSLTGSDGIYGLRASAEAFQSVYIVSHTSMNASLNFLPVSFLTVVLYANILYGRRAAR